MPAAPAGAAAWRGKPSSSGRPGNWRTPIGRLRRHIGLATAAAGSTPKAALRQQEGHVDVRPRRGRAAGVSPGEAFQFDLSGDWRSSPRADELVSSRRSPAAALLSRPIPSRPTMCCSTRSAGTAAFRGQGTAAARGHPRRTGAASRRLAAARARRVNGASASGQPPAVRGEFCNPGRPEGM